MRCDGTDEDKMVDWHDDMWVGRWRCRPKIRVRPGTSRTLEVVVVTETSRIGEEDKISRRGEDECATVDVDGVIIRTGRAGTLKLSPGVGVVARDISARRIVVVVIVSRDPVAARWLAASEDEWRKVGLKRTRARLDDGSVVVEAARFARARPTGEDDGERIIFLVCNGRAAGRFSADAMASFLVLCCRREQGVALQSRWKMIDSLGNLIDVTRKRKSRLLLNGTLR
jgi:hypothetical protein